jgi:hypothetical protein
MQTVKHLKYIKALHDKMYIFTLNVARGDNYE